MTAAIEIVEKALAGAAAPCITCSFQAEDVVVVHLLRQVQPSIPVLFLDTYHHFAETLAYRDQLARAWQLNIVNIKGGAAAGRPVANEHDRLLRAPQGGPALQRPRGLRHVVHGTAPRAVAEPGEPGRG